MLRSAWLALALLAPQAPQAQTAPAPPQGIDAAVSTWPWRGVGDPLVIGQTSLLLFGAADGGRGAIAWRLDWASQRSTRLALPGLPLHKDLRYSSAQSSAGVWLAGPVLALLRPDGRLLQAPLGVHQPPVVALADGSLLVFKDQESKAPRHILSVRLKPDGSSLQVQRLALLSFDGRPNESGKTYREPEYGHGAVLLKDARVLMFGDSRTPKLASILDPVSARISPVAPMPHERSLAAAVLLSDGRVAVAGAKHLSCTDAAARAVDLYDVQANAWTTLPPLPLPLCAEAYGATRPSVVEASDGSLVLGGSLEPELLTLARDATSPTGFAQAWRRLGSLPVPRIGGVLQALPDRRLVVAGGVHNPSGFGSCCERTVGLDRLSLADAPVAFGPGGLSFNGPGVARRGMRLFVAGGRRFGTTSSGQMRYGSQAELVDLKTGLATQLAPVPLVAGALDALWLDDDQVLVKGRLASSDRGFDGDYASAMPEGSGAMALYQVSKRSWTRIDRPELARSRLIDAQDGLLLFLADTGGLQTWRVGDPKAKPGPHTLAGGVGAVRWLADGRVVLAANQAPADIVSLQDEACEAQGSPCPERFIGLGPLAPARFYEVVKMGDPTFHQAVRHAATPGTVIVSAAIEPDGRLTRLSGQTQPAPGMALARSRALASASWDSLPLPTPWRPDVHPGEQDCGPVSEGGLGRCQLLSLPHPADPSGQRSLLFLRSTLAQRDGWEHGLGRTTVWAFMESTRSWLPVLQTEGLAARHAVFDLPKALQAGPGRLRSVGWHLDRPVLWVDR